MVLVALHMGGRMMVRVSIFGIPSNLHVYFSLDVSLRKDAYHAPLVFQNAKGMKCLLACHLRLHSQKAAPTSFTC